MTKKFRRGLTAVRTASGWFPVALLVIAAVALLILGRHHGLSDEVVGGLVGSFIGAAAILTGVLFDRHQRRADELASAENRHTKLRALIAAELVNVASGLIGAKDYVDSAVRETCTERSIPSADFARHLPRPMPFTANLGVELLTLSQREIDVLATLRANLTITEASIRKDIQDGDTCGWLVYRRIQESMRNDMRLLAEAFREFAPERKLALGSREPVVATLLLTRLSEDND